MSSFIIKNISETTQGLFSDKHFHPGETILRFDGVPVIKEEIKYFSEAEQLGLLQIGNDLYLNLKDHTAFFIRHHCVPNCIIKVITNKAFLIAIREIEPDDELVFDYSTTSNESKETFLMDCNCSKFYCRKEISGYDSLSEEQKQKYDKLGGIPKYLKG